MYRQALDPLDLEIARAGAAVRRSAEIRLQLVRLRRRRQLFPVSRRYRIGRLVAELRSLGDVEVELERLLRAKEEALGESPLAADAAALRHEIDRLRRAPDDGLSIDELIARGSRLQSLQKQRCRVLGVVC